MNPACSSNDGDSGCSERSAAVRNSDTQFTAAVLQHISYGGGVFLMPYTANVIRQMLVGLTTALGAVIPVEAILERDPGKVSRLHHAPQVPIAFTANVFASPVSANVSGIWYPLERCSYCNAFMAGPVLLNDSAWVAVLAASKTTITQPIDWKKDGLAPPAAPIARVPGVVAPTMFGVRNVVANVTDRLAEQYKYNPGHKLGRVALMNIWPQYHVGGGSKWIMNSQVLASGDGLGRPSDLGVLIRNTLRWLAEPAQQLRARCPGGCGPAPGGYVTTKDRLIWPSQRPEALRPYNEISQHYPSPQIQMQEHDPAHSNVSVFQGIFGAQSNYSIGGTHHISDFALAAKQVNLSFVVFLESFSSVSDPVALAALTAECALHSDAALQLIPGFLLDTNTGDHLFVYGNGIPLPPAATLSVNPLTKRQVLNWQPTLQNGGNFSGHVNNAAFEWLLKSQCDSCETSPGRAWNHGFYHFTDLSAGHPLLQIRDLRLYSVAATKYFTAEDGLVEDVTNQFIKSAEGTIPPTPIAISRVRSPAELTRAVVALGHDLTCVYATTVSEIWTHGLRYNDQYDSLSVFVSPAEGPQVRAWSGIQGDNALRQAFAVKTVAAESSIPGRSLWTTPISVAATAGLRSVSLFNGAELIQHFLFSALPVGDDPSVGQGGEMSSSTTHTFYRTLYLEGTVHRTLTLVAEDTRGRKAVTTARRAWKAGRRSVLFCTDHINDCQIGGVLAAHGPTSLQVRLCSSADRMVELSRFCQLLTY